MILAQGLIGFVQYATDLPAILVGAHLAGACLVWLAALSLWYATRTRTGAAHVRDDLPGSPDRFRRGPVSQTCSGTWPGPAAPGEVDHRKSGLRARG